MVCNGINGVMVMSGLKVRCGCQACVKASPSEAGRACFHPTHWEQHCGAGSAKKWKASIKIAPGGVPELPHNAPAMVIGKWFDAKGVDFRPAKTVGECVGVG